MIKEHPILFSGEMVRAILDGRKTQARWVIRYRRPWAIENDYWPHGHPLAPYAGNWPVTNTDEGMMPLSCPYGVPGDLMWVREAWQDLRPHQERVVYAATPGDVVTKWRPSIHMPRWASRITLRVVDVRVERLHDITFDDAIAEGFGSEREFNELFIKLNPHLKDANPWVWVVEFEKVTK